MKIISKIIFTFSEAPLWVYFAIIANFWFEMKQKKWWNRREWVVRVRPAITPERSHGKKSDSDREKYNCQLFPSSSPKSPILLCGTWNQDHTEVYTSSMLLVPLLPYFLYQLLVSIFPFFPTYYPFSFFTLNYLSHYDFFLRNKYGTPNSGVFVVHCFGSLHSTIIGIPLAPRFFFVSSPFFYLFFSLSCQFIISV